jgi:hypothetical protein
MCQVAEIAGMSHSTQLKKFKFKFLLFISIVLIYYRVRAYVLKQIVKPTESPSARGKHHMRQTMLV